MKNIIGEKISGKELNGWVPYTGPQPGLNENVKIFYKPDNYIVLKDDLVVYQGYVNDSIESTILKDLGTYPEYINLAIAQVLGVDEVMAFLSAIVYNKKIDKLKEHYLLATEDYKKYSNPSKEEIKAMDKDIAAFFKMLDSF